MTQDERLEYLLCCLLAEGKEYADIRMPDDRSEKRELLRSLMNVRPPMPLDAEFLRVQDAFLSIEREERGMVEADALPDRLGHPGIAVWQGDITRLKADAIVDADNDRLLGCFVPCHGCIDNAIHSAAGLQLRDECNRLMEQQGYPEPTGQAKLTGGYNLPARYVLHTVGPIIHGCVTPQDRELLASCYRSCLQLASEYGLQSVAFCCISTGEFHFPNQEAARIAVQTVKEFLKTPTTVRKVIFNVFKDIDAKIYTDLL